MRKLPDDMLAGVMVKVREIRMERRPVPRPGPGEVLVKVRSVGVCGSDVHWYSEGKLGGGVVTAPLVLGHEVAGEVVEAGQGVTGLKPGDRVCLEPGVPCGACGYCRGGRYNICRSLRFMGTPRGGTHDGAFREYLPHPAAFAFKLPDNVDFDSGALVEPFSVGIHACRQAGLAMGQRALIYGAGPIGLATLLAAGAAGAGEISVADIRPDRLELARKLGAMSTYSSLSDIPASAFDVVLECAAARPTAQDATRTVAPGGTITQVGTFVEVNFPIDLIEMMRKEARLTTVWRYANTYPTALDLMSTCRADLHSLITHRLPFARLQEAIEVARAGQPGTVKVMVEFE